MGNKPTTFPEALVPNLETRAGRMLEAGDIRVTVTDPNTDEHITVRFKAMLDNREQQRDGKRWMRVPIEEATHVFIEVPNHSGNFPDKIGTFYPPTGRFYADRLADFTRVGAAIVAAKWLNGQESALHRCQEESYCGKCGRTLTDPESIDKGIGPECDRQATKSQHQVKQRKMTQAEKDEVRELLNDLSELSPGQQEAVRRELEMWRSQEPQHTRR